MYGDKRVVTPVNGDWIYGLKLSSETTPKTLVRRLLAMELQEKERVRTSKHSDYPGISVFELFRAPTLAGEDEPISLEEAMRRRSKAMRFLLSVGADELVVVTSQMGYDVSSTAQIALNPHTDEPLPEVIMHDKASIDSLALVTRSHVSALLVSGGHPQVELPQERADAIFRGIIAHTVETNY